MFTAPLWLFALATLAIPLALHLWSRRPRDLIRVGSLRHVADLVEARSWSARLTEPLLLLLRLAILASVVLALAGPRLGGGRLGGTVSQLVLVEPALLADSAVVRADPLLDSLARSRATVRLLTGDLPRLQLDGVISDSGLAGGGLPPEHTTLWDLLLAADRLVSPGGTMLVIARPRVALLGGRRPALAATVRWHIPVAAPERHWLAGRWSVAPDTMLELTGWGSAGGTRYRSRLVKGTVPPGCGGCADTVAVLIQAGDTWSRRRVHLAALAVGALLGQTVELAPSPERADLVLATAPRSPPLQSALRPVALLTPVAIGSGALADTVLAHWPRTPLARDLSDPREVTPSQVLPDLGPLSAPERRDARQPLLFLALMLFAVERWLATRPRRSPA